MKTVLRNAIWFSGTALALAILADVFVFGLYQGGEPSAHHGQIVLIHALFLFALFFLSMLGAFFAFAIRRHQLPSVRGSAMLGMLYSVASFFAAVFAFQYGGLIASLVWLLCGAFGCALIGTVRKGAGHA